MMIGYGKRWFYGFVLLLVSTAGVLIALQGWKSRVPVFDLVFHMEDARQFVLSATVPKKGILTSLASYTPPGTTWLLVPSVYLVDDPRLYESIGTATLYLGTLVGIFILTRGWFGDRCAYLAVSLWAFSELGLFFARSLWPRAHPFFYVWMVYWTAKWVEQRHARYLAAALLTWAVGMYVFMEIAPAFFIIPALWLCYRPPIEARRLLVAGIVAAVVWFPYLRFEAGRDFADVKSQILQKRVLPANYETSWCDPLLLPAGWRRDVTPLEAGTVKISGNGDPAGSGVIRHMNALLGRADLALTQLLITNFNTSAGPGAGIVLLLLTLASLKLFTIEAVRQPRAAARHSQASQAKWLEWLGLSAILTAALLNEFTIARYVSSDGNLEPSTIFRVRTLQLLLLTAGTFAVTLRNQIPRWLSRITSPAGEAPQSDNRRVKATLLLTALLVPWLILLAITEPNRPERFWWLWPLQAIALASAVTYWPLRFKWPTSVVWVGSLAILFMVCRGPFASKIAAWSRDGWAGRDADEVAVVDYTADLIRSERKNEAAIGYDVYMDGFMAAFNVADRRYKVGAEIDLLFKYRQGIMNTETCAEGVSPIDEYRIVQIDRRSGKATDGMERIDARFDNRFRLMRQVGSYQVYKRG